MRFAKKSRNNRDRLKDLDPVRRLEILIDGDEELDVRGIRTRLDRLEKLVIAMLLISMFTSVGIWIESSDKLATLIPLIFGLTGG
ncbi:hypothetical protein LCGC14_1810470 [marine sediment metagenome]|uniref:Uncharacterized protein n=1 Tax=marine sediment metagenome TaxID=412755 RepID=A0A0F9J1Q4_9ZZZZ